MSLKCSIVCSHESARGVCDAEQRRCNCAGRRLECLYLRIRRRKRPRPESRKQADPLVPATLYHVSLQSAIPSQSRAAPRHRQRSTNVLSRSEEQESQRMGRKKKYRNATRRQRWGGAGSTCRGELPSTCRCGAALSLQPELARS